MKLPETQNANHQYAFKKGYRLAQEGKSLSAMPSAIRYDSEMREYFQQGWNQFQEDIALAEEEQESPWRRRAAWYLMMILAGIGTASLMIDEIEQAKQAKQPDTLQVTKTEMATPEISAPKRSINEATATTESTNPALQTNAQDLATTELSLLNDNARQDLILNKAEQKQAAEPKPLEEVLVQSNIHLRVAQLTSNIKDKKAIDNFNDEIIPKSVRKLYYFTQIEGAKGETIYHRWRYQNQIMATIPLTIKADVYRTWSSKRMSSAWQGEWTLEVLNAQQQPIHRQTFRYVQ
ncbi:DUF2914 domain-containing protein [Thiosulfativibrio zosterae]|uniref:DUF2914 domain-containing protein n=1 Tax=Thiosulfativibrio zosterae TaxID=2675053 RepID=A0A6F8PK83_9GAMM|nr:DUF2914 domain-containing protein [Thiosulfativibrio zosterae]BBP42509.1 hypothetical protein THMIRHAT_02550 [Thiosulfativibrio zosterae]